MDRISSLPDEIICHIGSFLSLKEAAFAMLLSRRWRNLFTIVPELSYDYKDEGSFTDFAGQVFALPLDSRIGKFSLHCKFQNIEPAHIDPCLSHVLKLGIVDLELDVIVEEEKEERYSPPLELFTCNTIAKLVLCDLHIDFLPENVYLPALKSLTLACVSFGSCAFDTLLCACHVLEELDIFDLKEWNWSRTFSSPTIKRLTIDLNFDREEYYDDSEIESISFDTPALTYLDYSDLVLKKYPIVNLNSLVEAKINLTNDEGFPSDPTNLIDGLKCVEILSLSTKTMELIHDAGAQVPVFENLSDLTFLSYDQCCWGGLRVLLHNSPKLKTLTIKGDLHRSKPLCECLLGYSFLLTCPIEILTINVYNGDTDEMLHVNHFLGKLLHLELLKIHIWPHNEDQEMEMKKDLLRIPRASSKCKIHVFNRFTKVYDEIEEAVSEQCEATIPKNGLRCKRNAEKGSKCCWQHKTSSPENSK